MPVHVPVGLLTPQAQDVQALGRNGSLNRQSDGVD